MVVLMDYACPKCGADERLQCDQCCGGRVRLPTGTVPYTIDAVLPLKKQEAIPDGPYAKVDVIDGCCVKVNGEKVDHPGIDSMVVAEIVRQTLEAAGCPMSIENFSEYECTDCVDYMEFDDDSQNTD